MKKYYTTILVFIMGLPAFPQARKVAVIGSSTAAGLATSSPDSAWVRRFNYYYKYQLGALDTTYNLGVSGTNVYSGMPTSFTPPGGYPVPDPAHNVTQAVSLLSDLPVAANGVVIVNFPSGGYDTYTNTEILSSLQTIYDSAVRTGNRCYITTTQPRTDGNFATSAVKRKLAVLKDSIINRFGVANTINFWDGMYNPADTTILPAYSAGDNVHFNNAGHRILFDRVVAKNIFALTATAATGDYRSNVSSTGLWSDASSWQTFNGTSWVAAATPPASSSGVVTIINGDSIRMNSATDFDQVVVETGAILAIFNTGTATTFTLNDGAGVDVSVNGKLYVSVGATLTGGGMIENNSGGIFILRNQGILGVTTINNGTTNISGTGNIQNATFTNYSTVNLVDFTLNLNNAVLTNYGTINFPYNSNSWIAVTSGSGTLINNAAGTMQVTNAAGIVQTTASIAFTNSGQVNGAGQFIFSNTIVNTGTIAPGNSPGLLTINPAFISGKTPVFNMEISSAGAVAGTNYDQVQFTTTGSTNVNVTGSTLMVTENTADPVGTVYTLFTFPSGTITGPFTSVQLSPTLGSITYNSNSITVRKNSLLPLTWGNFTAIANGTAVALSWTTLQEANTSHFIVEHATDGLTYTGIANLPAQGQSNRPITYEYMDAHPRTGVTNFYRIKQVDVDGKSSYSVVRMVHFTNNDAPAVRLSPNPVSQLLQVQVQTTDIGITIYDTKGRLLQRMDLLPGAQQLNVRDWPAGLYHIVVYKNQQWAAHYEIIKL